MRMMTFCLKAGASDIHNDLIKLIKITYEESFAGGDPATKAQDRGLQEEVPARPRQSLTQLAVGANLLVHKFTSSPILSVDRRILSSGAQIQPKKKIKGKSMLDANQARWFASTVSLQQDDKLPKLKPKEERTEGDDKDKLIRLLNQENQRLRDQNDKLQNQNIID